MHVHRVAVERSLALHRAVIDRARDEPAVIDRARERVRAWQRDGSVALPYVRRWQEILSLRFDDMARLVLEDSDGAHDLRQVSPFAGALSARERWRVLESVR